MDTIGRVIEEFFPGQDMSPRRRRLIKWVFGEEKIAPVLQKAKGKQGLDWVDSVVDTLQLRFEAHGGDYDNIPSQGPLIVIANHPTVIDGLALMSTISRVRKDVKIIANHVLTFLFPQIKDISIGIRNMHGKMSHRQFKEMSDHLEKGGVLLICPAGRLAGLSLGGLRESPWHSGFIHLARRTRATLLPVHIRGINSVWYYMAALAWRPLSNLMIFREIARHQGSTLRMRICQPIGVSALKTDEALETLAADCRAHLLSVGKGKPGVVPTLPALAAPESRSLLANALSRCEVLKTLGDGKRIYLYRYQDEAYSPILQELGRLREASFRALAMGSGEKRDNDVYDPDYYHVILWDPQALEIVGAYRIVPAGEQIAKRGVEGLYSYSLFQYTRLLTADVAESFEVGRGFIQHQYQKTNALDALWKGIFCFSQRYPDYKNLLGVLTIPKNYSVSAQRLIIDFYQCYFSAPHQAGLMAGEANWPNSTSGTLFSGDDFRADWKRLNTLLDEAGYQLPWPFKQMARWFYLGGSMLLGFKDDQSFNSIAGLSICKLAALKKSYQSHYIKTA
ncbi:hemolysin [Serratia sp. MYb239]|uniref:lysophospholipid acyltransferase family protein n=1 Tax=Serratia sp. MYb239 TaxID=2033438 RepID=UPI000CF652CA|nr:lysophospholipid acyltransferase family protein [Serratia sp. MYb239]AVJ15911.1 hemolysin [Serratia sp. MYb239]